jgi:hypothetical protein
MRKISLLCIALVSLLAPEAVIAGAPPPPQNGFVVANGDGTVVRSTLYTVFHVTTGQYEVDTIPNIHPCAYSVTAGSGDATIPAPTIATAVGRRENHTAIMVATFDHDGNYADAGFHLIVRCTNAQTDGAAVVDPDGTLVRGIFASGATRTGTGAYRVTFSNSAFSTTCAYTAAVGLSGTSGVSDPGFVNVAAVSAGTIAVMTYDKNGNPADLGFQVFGACNL